LPEYVNACRATRFCQWLADPGWADAIAWTFDRIDAQRTEIIGAPRSMKMGTIVSLWRYDSGACHALQSANLRQPTILRYAPWAAVFPISQDGPVALR
jgi:hypothetical protein